MSSINNFFRRLKERPSLYFILLALITAFSAIEAYNPIIRKYGSFSHVLEENYVKKLSDWLVNAGDFMTSGAKTVYYILFAVLILLIFSAISALFFSGYANKLLLAVEGKKKEKGEFVQGIKQKFFKTLLYIYSAVVLSAAFYFMVIYAAVPVFFRINQLTDGNADVLFSALIMGLLTLIVVVFALVFYCMYFSYILPSISGLKRGVVLAGLRMTNTYIWYLLPKTLMFMIGEALIRTLLFVIHYGHSSVEMSILVLCITSLLRSVLYFVYLYFTFNTFVAMREDLYPEYSDANDEEEVAEEAMVAQKIEKKNEKPVAKQVKQNMQNNMDSYTDDNQRKIEFEEDDNDEEELQINRFSRNIKGRNVKTEDTTAANSATENTRVEDDFKSQTSSRRNRVVSKPLEEIKMKKSEIKAETNDLAEDDYDDSF